MTRPASSNELVHGQLAHWSGARAGQLALDDGRMSLTFRELHEAVEARAGELAQCRAPATVLIDDRQPTIQRVVNFLGVIASGRCAVVTDPEWTEATRQAVRAAFDTSPASPCAPTPATPFYIGFTSGSTGRPKGFRRHHRSWTTSFQACIETFGPDAASRIAVSGRFSHSLFLFGVLHGLWCGAGVVLQESFSAARLLATLAEGNTRSLIAVPSQLVMALEAAARRRIRPIEGVRLVLISGARWMRERTPELRALFPHARIIEFYGASETSFITWMEADEYAPSQMVGHPFPGVEIEIRNPHESDGAGLIFVRSPMVFTDYATGAADTTSALRDGQWLSVRDIGRIDASGCLHLIGRESRMIVTQGKNLFPEEVESVLLAHELVAAASVHGLRHPVRGQEVGAVLCLRPQSRPSAAVLTTWCRERLEAYKVPRVLFACDTWPFTPSGKTDHQRIGELLVRGAGTSWLRPLS